MKLKEVYALTLHVMRVAKLLGLRQTSLTVKKIQLYSLVGKTTESFFVIN